MNTLHALFAQRDQQAFQRLLEKARNATSGSASNSGSGQSGGRSWTKSSPANQKSHPRDFDVNARDWLGRTVLHLACSSCEPSAPEYVRLLLAYPGINVNAQDLENQWTPLHRALYNGNVVIAVSLLERGEIDMTIRDAEGNTAIDLYNSTVNYTKPSVADARLHIAGKGPGPPMELYTWGANRNATLGLGDGNDRVHPERVHLYPTSKTKSSSQLPSSVSQVGMSKLHTAVVTNDPTNNVRVCGFGLGGRLGQTQHTQYEFIPMKIPQRIIKVALGQDHTLALTESGEVVSWGLNRFSQLGYTVESADLIQPTARKIAGPLRGKRIDGIAACKAASVCWSMSELFAWGTNNGQFGWTREYNPILTVPKVVTKVDESVVDLALSDSAMVCLGVSGAVVCLWDGRSIRVPFQLPNTILPHASNQHTQFARFANITKLSICDDVFGALSTDGELFIFSPPEPKAPSGEKVVIKPQLVWALRKAFTAVKDFSMAADGSILLCTESGHVFLRTRNPKATQSGAKAFKFKRIPYIQRVTSVYSNNMGAFAVLRADFAPDPIRLTGNLMNEDLADLLPFWDNRPTWSIISHTPEDNAFNGVDQDEEANSLGTDIPCMRGLCDFLFPVSLGDPESKVPGGAYNAPGADVVIRVQKGYEIPTHRCILAARSSVLASVLSGQTPVVQDPSSNFVIKTTSGRSGKYPQMAPLSITGCHAMSVLVLLYYLYSDEVLAVWDPRVTRDVVDRMRVYGKINPHTIRSELRVLAKILELPLFEAPLRVVTKLAPEKSIVKDFSCAFAMMQDPARRATYKPDVVLELADKRIYCHSTVLRARSEFFAAFFNDEDWARNRWTPEDIVVVDLKHVGWRPMEFVLKFLCAGEDAEMFDSLDYINSTEDLVNLMLEVIAVSNELLVDRLTLICSSIILRHIDLTNVCALYSEAVYYHLEELVSRLEAYIVVNMEALIAYRMLGVLPYDLLKKISSAVRTEQSNKSQVTRSPFFVDRAMEKYGDWLRLQDIPQSIVRNQSTRDRSEVPRRRSIPSGPTPFTMSRSVSEDIFHMDGDGVSCSPPAPPESPAIKKTPSKQTLGWKEMGPIIKHDMKSIMAETERNTTSQAPPKDGLSTAKWTPRTPPRPERMPATSALPVSSSPSKKVDLKMTPVITPGSRTVVRPDITGSGLSTTRPQGLGPAPGGVKPQAQTPPETIVSKPPTRVPPPLTQTQSAQGSQTTTPVKPSTGSPSIRRTSSGSNPWANNPPANGQPSQSRVTSFAEIQSLQEEAKLPKGKQKQSLKEIQEEERARAAEEDFLKWWAAEEERVKKEEEEAVRAAMAMAKNEGRGGGNGKRQHGRGGGSRKSSRGKQQSERRHAALSTGQ